ncbi:PREDICTED: crocetin glucosyltransferase, chloroplastic-like [Fragaria vesca subsp. vesca]|uniref:crocetin glucosyltransferase, chloroplastic-like n=1 Tax=Fragaria vesca subsp. vesca TaxID=101020 RepID=UPI0002C35004|nr:PREDICTED: crocetin glucosyltransferase, chloroplastic-like [Fragaria vesca subsp. vesca]
MESRNHHFLVISCAAQGHLNPSLQLAKRLIDIGSSHVTFVTNIHGLTQIKSLPSLEGLSFASFSDGFDDGVHPANDPEHIMSELKRAGSESLTALIEKISTSDEHGPITFLIYTVLLPWAAEVASSFGIASAFLCITSATSFAICGHYFKDYYKSQSSLPFPSCITIDGLPPFASDELPSYLLPTSPHVSILPTFQEHYQIWEKSPNSCVLVNTFDGLEEAAIRDMRAHMNLITVGPLIRSAEVCCDLFDKSGDDYLQWLDTKADSSVVYVSFGSMVVLRSGQMEEMLHGLVDSGLPVLWVIRKSGNEGDQETENLINNTLKKEQGLIVPWCSQVEVLSHKSVGCCVSHCGWNSTIESLAAGVPVVGCPHFADQTTNAKLVEELWGSGVRARANEEGVIERAEIKRCLEVVMGDGVRGEEMRRNAQKWKSLAMKAVNESGSSDDNLRNFVRSLA